MGTLEPDEHERREWEAEFEAASRRPLRTRLRYAFIHTYKPVLDDATYRSFDSMAEYRAWCAAFRSAIRTTSSAARKPPTG